VSDFESQLASQPHDAFFKAQFSKLDVARAFFESQLPSDLIRRIDWSQMQLENASFVKETYKQLHSDLIFTAPLADKPLRLSIIFEHQTQVHPLMPLRFGEYLLEHARQQLKQAPLPLSPILCVVIHQGPEPWTVSTQFSDLFFSLPELKDTLAPFIPQFQHLLIDLTQIDPTLENEPNLRVILNLMKLARLKDRILDFFQWLDSEIALQLEDQLLRECLIYSLHIDQSIDFNAICSTIQKNQQFATQTMTIAQKLRDEGRLEGIEEGIEEGKLKGIEKGVWIGKIQTLQELIHQPVSSTETLQTLSMEQLTQLFQDLEAQYTAQHKK
jgi:hypothetical protein